MDLKQLRNHISAWQSKHGRAEVMLVHTATYEALYQDAVEADRQARADFQKCYNTLPPFTPITRSFNVLFGVPIQVVDTLRPDMHDGVVLLKHYTEGDPLPFDDVQAQVNPKTRYAVIARTERDFKDHCKQVLHVSALSSQALHIPTFNMIRGLHADDVLVTVVTHANGLPPYNELSPILDYIRSYGFRWRSESEHRAVELAVKALKE